METNCNNLRRPWRELSELKYVQQLVHSWHTESASKCPPWVLLRRAGITQPSPGLGFLSAPGWQGVGCTLHATDLRGTMCPSLCKHWIWIPLTYCKTLVATALTAHAMGILLTGISAGDPKLRKVAVSMSPVIYAISMGLGGRNWKEFCNP